MSLNVDKSILFIVLLLCGASAYRKFKSESMDDSENSDGETEDQQVPLSGIINKDESVENEDSKPIYRYRGRIGFPNQRAPCRGGSSEFEDEDEKPVFRPRYPLRHDRYPQRYPAYRKFKPESMDDSENSDGETEDQQDPLSGIINKDESVENEDSEPIYRYRQRIGFPNQRAPHRGGSSEFEDEDEKPVFRPIYPVRHDRYPQRYPIHKNRYPKQNDRYPHRWDYRYLEESGEEEEPKKPYYGQRDWRRYKANN